MRPALFLFIFLTLILASDLGMVSYAHLRGGSENRITELQALVGELGISDLCLTTEARYTRHLAVSDSLAPFMDHPGAIDHFPSGSFFYPANLH